MAMTQKQIKRFVGQMIAKGIPTQDWNRISRENTELRRNANVFCLSLSTVQAAGGIVASLASVFIMAFNTFVMKGCFHSLFLHQHSDAVTYALEAFSYIAYMFVPMLLIFFVCKINPVRQLRESAKPVKTPWMLLPAIPVAMAFYFVGTYLAGIVTYLFSLAKLQPIPPNMLMEPKTTAGFVIFCIQVCVLAPLMEEFLFRGIILRRLLPYGPGFAIFTSSLLFAMLHGNLLQIPFAFCVGLALGYFAYKMDSVWASIPLHALINATSTVMDVVTKQIGSQRAEQIELLLMLSTAILFCVSAIVLFLTGAIGSKKDGEKKITALRGQSFYRTAGFFVFLGLSVLYCVMLIRPLP